MKRRTDTQDADAPPVARETAVQTPPKLDPALTAPAELLRRFIEVAETGYAICVCNAPAERRRILDSLLPELTDKGNGIFELELDRAVETIPGRIRVALTSDAFRALAIRFNTVAISLTGAEATITDAERKSAGRPRVLQGLNQQRDWMDLLGHPVIFWVSEWLLGLLPRVAPDFWAGRSVVIQFPSADEARAHAYQEVSSGPWTFSSLDEAKRKMRIYEDLVRGEKDPSAKAGFLHNLAIIHQSLGDIAEARKLYEQSLAIKWELVDKSGIAKALHQLATLAQAQGDLAEARKLYDQSLAIERELGNRSGIAKALHQLGNIAYLQGNLAEARKLYDQSLAIKQELRDKAGIAQTLHQLANVSYLQGDLAEARKLYNESLAIKQELGNKPGIAISLGQLGRLAEAERDDRTALKNYLRALAIFDELKSPTKGIVGRWLADMQKRLGDEAFKKLSDEVVAEPKQPTAHS